MTKQVKRIVRQKQRHYNTYQADRTQQNYDQYKKTEKACKKQLGRLKDRLNKILQKMETRNPLIHTLRVKQPQG